jgi:hypothetical protein
MSPAPFAVLIFWIESLILPGVGLGPPSSYAAGIAKIKDAQLHAWFVDWDGGLANFLPGLALNHDPFGLCLPNSWDCRSKPPCLAPRKYIYSMHDRWPQSLWDTVTTVAEDIHSTTAFKD